ncbi:MAG: guanylate kinase, partial [Oscillospiraceae bacterium]
MSRRGRLFVVSGPSGVGKSTVISKVLEANPNIRFSVSATTRSPRPSETDGKDYYFVSRDDFEKMIE